MARAFSRKLTLRCLGLDSTAVEERRTIIGVTQRRIFAAVTSVCYGMDKGEYIDVVYPISIEESHQTFPA